jgi:flagellar protein FlaG
MKMAIETIGPNTGNENMLRSANETSRVLQNQQLSKVQAEQVLPPQEVTPGDYSEREINLAIEQVQVMMDLRNRSVEFTTDTESGAQVVKVVDSDSGDVIRQIPAEELLSFMRNLTRMLGTFIDETT